MKSISYEQEFYRIALTFVLVYDKEEYCLLSCLQFIMTNYQSTCRLLVSVVV